VVFYLPLIKDASENDGQNAAPSDREQPSHAPGGARIFE